MGGGAGIQFEFRMERTTVSFHPRSKERPFQLTEPLTIHSFDANGYMDGMADVDGALLKPTHVTISPDGVDIPGLANYYKPGDTIGVCSKMTSSRYEHTLPRLCLFSGYCRGKATDISTYEISYTTELDSGDGSEVRISFYVDPLPQFSEWYEDVFNYDYSEFDDEIDPADAAELRWDDLKQHWKPGGWWTPAPKKRHIPLARARAPRMWVMSGLMNA